MSSNIPYQNIYYMLLYAWNRLPEGTNIDVSGIAMPDLPNLLTKVLIDGTHQVICRGLDRGYITNDEDLHRPRGRIQISDTIQRALLSRTLVACNTDNLSHNVLQNRVIRATLERLARTENVDSKLREALLGTLQSLTEVTSIALTARDFGRIELHGNNAFYAFLLRVCELIFNSLMPSPEKDKFIFRDVLTDPQTMGHIFQDFIRNFYKIEQKAFRVKGDSLGWAVSERGRGDYLMPSLNTDVSLYSLYGDQRYILIECKWTDKTFQFNRGVKSLRSEHLYQIYAYVRNHPQSKLNAAAVEGLVLYAQVDEPVDVSVCLEGHIVRVRTLDLQCDWPHIKHQLLSMIGERQAAPGAAIHSSPYAETQPSWPFHSTKQNG
jgi:5-methylcytosine-specific restriction enzyme subunit McrC